MKKIIFILFLLFSTSSFAAAIGSIGLINIAQSIPCGNGGDITISGIYNVDNYNISADLTFKNCTYVSDEDTVTLNGSATISGTLPVDTGNLNLSLNYTDVEVKTVSSDENMNEKCSGSLIFSGAINNGAGNITRDGTMSCTGKSTSQTTINGLINNVLNLDF